MELFEIFKDLAASRSDTCFLPVIFRLILAKLEGVKTDRGLPEPGRSSRVPLAMVLLQKRRNAFLVIQFDLYSPVYK